MTSDSISARPRIIGPRIWPAAPGFRAMPSSAPAAARPWPMPPPRAARPMPRPAPSAICPKLLARPWLLIRSASETACANAGLAISRTTSDDTTEARILIVRVMGVPSSRAKRESMLLMLDRHADVDHGEGGEHQRLDEAHQQAEQQERQRDEDRDQREERHHDLVVGEHVAH